MSTWDDADVIVIGGGIVGASIAYGLARSGRFALLLDEGDDAFRAARGNFGLVWVQGKGPGAPHYARWTMRSAADWPALARDLAGETSIDVQLSQPGGLHLCLHESELAERQKVLSGLRAALNTEYPFELLDRGAAVQLCPHVGPEVVGASFGPLDGHVNPLRLLRALLQAFTQRGGRLATGHRVTSITQHGGVFDVVTSTGRFSAPRVVLTAGLGNRELAPMVGLEAPVIPNRGEILVSERLQPFLHHPTAHVRQTGDGGVQLGDSKEDVGYDDRTALAELSRIADRAVRMFPLLGRVNVVRAWGALRVMTADGLPIYEASATHPGAYVVTCHSGITLAAVHADELSKWILGGTQPQEIAPLVAARLEHVQATSHH